MKYIRLGNTGLKVSRICLGTMTYGSPKWREWVLPDSESHLFFARSLEAGINFFDTADMYSLGASKMNHPEDALSALEIELTQEECQRLEEPYQPHPVLGHRSYWNYAANF